MKERVLNFTTESVHCLYGGVKIPWIVTNKQKKVKSGWISSRHAKSLAKPHEVVFYPAFAGSANRLLCTKLGCLDVVTESIPFWEGGGGRRGE